MLAALALLFAPVCATIAGLIVWASHRHESLDDGALLRHFLIVLILTTALFWGLARTDAVRRRVDPQFRIQTEIDSSPVYSAVKRFDPDDAHALEEVLRLHMSHGQTLSQALLQARSLLTRSVTARLGFADQESTLIWGRLVVDTLEELRDRDPELCYRAMAGQSLDERDLAQAFSAENTEAFERAVVHLYESADRGMRRERTPGDVPADFNKTALEFHAIQEEIEQQFGHDIAAQIARKKFPQRPAAPAAQICAARISQLEAMLKRPKPAASLLIDSALR